eukprot:9051541-Lingulodinium_polyedra.AAC.1
MEFLRSAKLYNKEWHMRLLSYCNIAVLEAKQGDKTRPLHKHPFLGQKPSAAAASSSGDSGALKGTKAAAKEQMRAARATCSNTLDLATRFLLDPSARTMSSMLVEVGGPCDDWHSTQNSLNRSPEECLQFYLGEAAGDGLQTLAATLQTLRSPGTLEECGF